jgi:hypothetical protein
MNTRTLPHTLSLHRGLVAAFVDQLAYGWQRLQSAWAEHRARRLAEDVEHELMRLDPRTLHDIGASEGLVGQRRWQEEERGGRGTDRLLDMRGW